MQPTTDDASHNEALSCRVAALNWLDFEAVNKAGSRGQSL